MNDSIVAEKKENKSARHGGAGNVPSHIHLCSALCHSFCYCEDLMGNMLVHVILTAVRADLGRNIFHDQGHPLTVKGNSRCALFGFTVFADYALHDFLRVKLSDHESGSGIQNWDD